MILERAMTGTAPDLSYGAAGSLSAWGGVNPTISRPIALYPPADSDSSPFLERRAVVVDRRRSRRSYPSLDLLIAFAVLVGVLVLANANSSPKGLADFLAMRLTVKNILLLGVFGTDWVASFAAFGLYRRRVLHGRVQETFRILVACTLGSVPVFLFPVLSHNTGALTYASAVLFWLVVMMATLAMRMGTQLVHHAARQRVTHRVIIVGTGPRAMELARQLKDDAQTRYDILGFVDTREVVVRGQSPDCNLGVLEDLEQTLMHTVVDEVLIALPIKSHYEHIENAIRACERAGVQSKHLADVFTTSLARPRLGTSGNLAVMAMPVVHDDYRVVVKRALDMFGVVVALPVILPVGLCVAAAVKLTSRGPIFFGQERYGYSKRRFRMYKFRTMVTDAEALQAALESKNEAAGPVFKIKQDPRVTRVGRFLRKTSLDELPQLLNVLKGDMSLVGPRPLAIRDVHRFTEPWLMRRFSVYPGLTCLWQISGRSNLSFDEWVKLDLDYIDRWSLFLDARILLRTVPAVLKGTGAS